MDENTPEVTEVTEPTVDISAEESYLPNTSDVKEAIQKARAQEKAKLYPQVEKLQEELALLRSKEQEREAKEAERKAARQAREAEAAAERKKQEESELEVRDLLSKKEQEWKSQLETERLEREKAFALLDQERKYQELSQYRQARLEAERDNIIPELVDLISGNSQDEIEQSIASLKDKSARILDSAQQALQSTRREMAGTRITSPASGPLDNDSEQRSYSPENIREMSLADYAKQRAKLLGEAAGNRGKGLFG
jgi:hypothetical protein